MVSYCFFFVCVFWVVGTYVSSSVDLPRLGEDRLSCDDSSGAEDADEGEQALSASEVGSRTLEEFRLALRVARLVICSRRWEKKRVCVINETSVWEFEVVLS